MTTATRSNPKWEVVKHLMDNGFTPEEIINLRKENVTKRGIENDTKEAKLTPEVVQAFAKYLKLKGTKTEKALFASLDGQHMTLSNFKLSFKSWAKKNGVDTSKFNLGRKRVSRAKIPLDTMEDIASFLNPQ